MKIKTLLFGAGPGAERFIKRTSDSRLFVGILDNDKEKTGKEYFGLKVYSPGDVHHIEFDEIIITTQWGIAVRHQLIDELGVEEKKVILPEKNQLKETLPFYNAASITLGRKIIQEVAARAMQQSIPLVIDFGTLLGIVRDGDIIEWDDDIDFSAPFEYAREVEDIIMDFAKSNKEVCWRVDKITNSKGIVTSILLRFTDNNNVLDSFITSIAFRENRDGNSIHLPSVGMWFSPEIHFSKTDTISWNGLALQTPWLYKDYLSFQYGDWSKPKKNIKLTDYANLNIVTFSDIRNEGRQHTSTSLTSVQST